MIVGAPMQRLDDLDFRLDAVRAARRSVAGRSQVTWVVLELLVSLALEIPKLMSPVCGQLLAELPATRWVCL